MKHSAFIMLVATVVCGPAALSGQATPPPVPQRLSLREAVELANRYNPAMRQTRNDLAPAAWGVRNAYASFLPYVRLTGGVGYSGAGTQNFLTTSFEQLSSTVGSSYQISMTLSLNGRSLLQPALAGAQLRAVDASITGAEINLESLVRQQYLAVLQAEAQAELSDVQVSRNEEFLRLARARFEVGQNTILDVRQAEVSFGQAQITRLQDRQAEVVEKLRLFQQMGVPAPEDPSTVTLSDTFPIAEPQWQLADLLSDALDYNPDLIALRGQHSADLANERAVKSEWLPSLSFSAGWSGFTQQYTDPDPLIQNSIQRAQHNAADALAACQFQNDIIAGLATPTVNPLDCSTYQFSDADAAALRQGIRQANSVFPFNFTSSPFSASVGVSLPIFTQFSRPMRNSQASAQEADSREAVRARELDVRTQVSQAYYGLLAAYEAIDIQAQNRAAAREGLILATERYRIGSGTVFDVLDAQLTTETAERDYINAVYAYHQAIATLEAAVGRPLR